MTEPTRTHVTKRRGFFAAIGLGSAAAVATAVSVAPKPAEAMTPAPAKGGKHYSESEHVKQYYRVNRY